MTRKLSGLISLLLIAIALALIAPRLRALAPPPPAEVNIKVKREVRSEIPLKIYGRRNELLKFLIRTPPEHGQITAPEQTGQETAAVIYDPPEDLNITHDKFFYSVQSSEGVSAPVEVTITIIDAPPILTNPPPVDFPRILAGTTSTKIIQLSNRGGSLAIGEMVVDPPWRIDGSSNYRIKAGEIVSFKVVFEPKTGGKFEGAISYSSNREHSTMLHGEAYTPLSASPEKVALENSPGDPLRTGSFEISNQTDAERTAQIRGGARILTPDKVSVPAHGKVTVPIHTSPSDVDPIDVEIRIESEGFSLVVPVKSPAVEPIFKFSSNLVSLGREPAAKPGAGSVTIENTGGTKGTISLTVAAPFRVDPSVVTLNPGEKKPVRITLAPSAPGKYRTWVGSKGGRQSIEIGLEAELYGTAAPARAPTGSESAASAQDAEASHTGQLPPSKREIEHIKPAVPKEWGIITILPPGFKWLKTTPDSVKFEWPERTGSADRFRFEFRHLGLDASRAMTVSWIEHQPAKVERANGFYIATLSELKPGEMFALQVVPLSNDGQPEPRLFAVSFGTPPRLSSTIRVSSFHWLLIGLAVCAGIWIWRATHHRPTNFL